MIHVDVAGLVCNSYCTKTFQGAQLFSTTPETHFSLPQWDFFTRTSCWGWICLHFTLPWSWYFTCCSCLFVTVFSRSGFNRLNWVCRWCFRNNSAGGIPITVWEVVWYRSRNFARRCWRVTFFCSSSTSNKFKFLARKLWSIVQNELSRNSIEENTARNVSTVLEEGVVVMGKTSNHWEWLSMTIKSCCSLNSASSMCTLCHTRVAHFHGCGSATGGDLRTAWQLKGSVEGRRKYLFHCDFPSCSESTEIWHADSFCVPVFFFQEGRKIKPKLHENIVGFRSLRTKTLYMCVFYAIGGGGGRKGGVDFQERVWSLISPLVEKNTGSFFDTKRAGMPNCSGFRATFKIAMK